MLVSSILSGVVIRIGVIAAFTAEAKRLRTTIVSRLVSTTATVLARVTGGSESQRWMMERAYSNQARSIMWN